MQSTNNKEFTAKFPISAQFRPISQAKSKYTTWQSELYQRRRKASVHYMLEWSLAKKLK